jgi:hypothetical protein
MVINAVPPPLLPFQEYPSIDRGCVGVRNILRGGIVVVVDLETHVPNEGNIFRPILRVEDKVRNVFSPLVDIGGGWRFGWSRILPKLIRWPFFFYLNPSLRRMEEAGDSAAPKENGDERLPPTGRRFTANGSEILNTPARLGVDKGCCNVLRRPDELDEA